MRKHLTITLLTLLLVLVLGTAGAQSDGQKVEISTDFPGGNVLVIGKEDATVRLKPDLRGGRDWFYWNFDATAAQAGEVEFLFEGKLRIGVRGPAVSEDGGLTWRWLGTGNVRYSDKTGEGDGASTEAFRYRFSKAGESRRFAVAIPYLQRDLDGFLDRVAENANLSVSRLTTSGGGREVKLLRIGEPGPEREAIIVSARHHACESMASYVLEGFLEAAISDSWAAKEFRERYVLYAVPMMDGDGVQAGDQGKWRFPHDHNRDYGDGAVYSEVQAVQKLAGEVGVRLALDFHCPSLRGETHEVFYFVGVGYPYIHDNTDELRGWIDEERPQSIGSGPFNFLHKAPEKMPEVLKGLKFSEWFIFQPGVRFAATFEIPYTLPGTEMDAAMARDYGRSVLRAWQRSRFFADPVERPEGSGHLGLAEFRKKFASEYKSKPEAAERSALLLMGDSATAPAMRSEALNSMGLLRLRQSRYAEARDFFSQVLVDADSATARQSQTAACQLVVAACRDPDSDRAAVEAALRTYAEIGNGAQSASSLFEANGAASEYFEKSADAATALKHAQLQLPAASKIQRGATLNGIAELHDALGQPELADAARRQAVDHLRGQLDPMPPGIFGALMAKDLFDALIALPAPTVEEIKSAAEMVFEHPVASEKMKAEVGQALRRWLDRGPDD